MMKINEIFGNTIQGEGVFCGSKAIFIRLAGCNKKCRFCDTEYRSYNEMRPIEVMKVVKKILKDSITSFVIITGGEPLLQAKELKELLLLLKKKNLKIHLETNGSLSLQGLEFDHIECSPKQPIRTLKIERIDSIKLIFPYFKEAHPINIIGANNNFGVRYFSIQPVDPDKSKENISNAINEINKLPSDWRLSIQIHKLIGVK